MTDVYHNPYVEDCDSDGNISFTPETRRETGKQPSSTKPLPHIHHKVHRDAASDSGYSSHTSNTVASSSRSQPIATSRPQTASGNHHVAANLNKPVITRSESQRPRTSRSDSMSRPPPQCTDPHCGDPNCASKRNGERGYTLPLRPQSQQTPQRSHSTQYPVQDSAPYSQAPKYPYAPLPHGQPAPGYNQQPQSRRPTSSTSRSRPVSWAASADVPIHYPYGMAPPQGNYNSQQYGPPSSPSTHNRSYLSHHQTASGDWSAMAASGSPRDSFGSYMQGHGMPIPSNDPAYRPPMTHAYSARQVVPTTSSRDPLNLATEHAQPSQPVISARRSSAMPGSFPGEALNFGPASDSSSSESSDSEEEERHYEQQQRRREKKIVQTRRALEDRDRRAMPPPISTRERRPTLPHARTTPVDARRAQSQSREPLQRARYSASEYADVDRASRPAAEKRLTHSHDRVTRQPSITHHPSTRRRESVSISPESRLGQQYVVEDAHGRIKVYDTLEEAQAKARRLKQQQHIDEAEAYQATNRGNTHPATLTAEGVKRAQSHHHQEQRAASHVSGSSRKSIASSSRTTSDSIQITRNGTTFNIPVNAHLEVRQTEEGETWVIGSGSPPREKSYYGGSSKSSGSRVGRSRNGSVMGGRRRDTITEEGYEPRL